MKITPFNNLSFQARIRNREHSANSYIANEYSKAMATTATGTATSATVFPPLTNYIIDAELLKEVDGRLLVTGGLLGLVGSATLFTVVDNLIPKDPSDKDDDFI